MRINHYIRVLFLGICILACNIPKVSKKASEVLEIDIEKVKLVHSYNPMLSEDFKDSVNRLPGGIICDNDMPTRQGVYFQLKFRNYTDSIVEVYADSFQQCSQDNYCMWVYGLNDSLRIAPYTNIHATIRLNPGDSAVKQLLVIAHHLNKFENLGVILERLLSAAWGFQKKEYFLAYNFANAKRRIEFSENIPVEIWYSFDFRTFEEAYKYGQPYLASENDTARHSFWFYMPPN